MTDTLVAINIINTLDNTLVNNQTYPILYYWSGEDYSELSESLQNDENFKKYVFKDITNYFTSKIYFFFFDDRNNDEQYIEQNMSLQEYVKFDELTDQQKRELISHYIFPVFDKLYVDVFKTHYPNNDKDNIYNILKSIYTKIKNKYGERVSERTVINYVRSELMNERFYKLIQEETRKSLFKLIYDTIHE